MLTFLRKRQPRESGFTMIELLVAVVIIAILAAIAVPVYLGIKTEAQKSALKSDVNATVKKVAIALTQDTPIDTIVLDNGAAYVPTDLAKGETISVVKADSSGNITTASYTQDSDLSDSGYVIKSATYTGPADGIARAKTAAASDNQYFFVYGVLQKSAGASADFSYSYTSVKDKFSQGSGNGTSATASAPTLADQTLPAATIGDAYAGATITATGTPSATITATGLPTGMTISAAGVISGTPSDAAGNFTVHVTATNPVSSVTKDYPLLLKSKNQTPAFTSATTAATAVAGSPYAGFTVTASGYPAPTFTSSDITPKTGLTLDPDGTIHGTALASASGNITVTVTATNVAGTPTQTLTIPVNHAPAITTTNLTLPAAAQYGAYPSATPVVAATGFPNPTFSAPSATGTSKTGLPIGLSITSDGIITGTPSGSAPVGPYSIVITASNGVGTAVSKTFTMNLTTATPIFSQSGATVLGWTAQTGTSISSTAGGMYLSSNGVTEGAYYTTSGLTVGAKYTLTENMSSTYYYGAMYITVGYGSASSTTPTATADGAAGYVSQAATASITFTATASTMRLYAQTYNTSSSISRATISSVTLTPAG